MSNIRLYIVLGIVFISLTINGCSQSNDDSSVVSAFSDSIIEIPEPADSLNEGVSLNRGNAGNTDTEIEGANGTSEDIVVEGEIVEGTALTQEEIDQLKASAKDIYQEGLEGYQQIMEEGTWVVPETGGMTCSEVVGKPGDTSWRQMTDEEARAYMEEKPGSSIGEAELMNGTWSALFKGKLYFNPYEYEKAMKEAVSQVDSFTEADVHD